jgi:diguanylate cyclase (GGDEF)-like protein
MVFLGIVCLLPVPVAVRGGGAAATQASSTPADAGAVFDTLASRYGVRGEDQAASNDVINTRLVELAGVLPANDPVRSARLDAYRCLSLFDGEVAALARAEAGLAEWPAEREPLVRMEYLMCKVYAMYNLGDRSEYVVPLNEVLALADGERYPRLRAGALFMRSFRERAQGRYAQELATLREVLELDRGRGATKLVPLTDVVIAGTLVDLGLIERAIEVLASLEKPARDAGDGWFLWSVLQALGEAEQLAGRPETALAHYREAQSIARTTDMFDSHAALMLSIALLHVQAGRLDDARSARQEAEQLLIRGRVPEALRARRGYLDALIALESGDAARAAQLVPDVLRRLREDDQLQPLADALDVQARAYRELGQWRAALDAREEQVRLRAQLDQRMQREQARVLSAELALSRETAEKHRLLRQADAQRLQLQAAQSEQRLRLVVIVLLTLLLGAMVGLLFLTRHRLRGARHAAMTDSLTGVASRRHMLDQLARLLTDRRSAASPLSVLAIDIDHFKQINDRFGHIVGDEVLRRVAETCRRALRESDEFGRMGGEEFMAVLTRTALVNAVQLGERLCEAVAALVMDDVAPGLRVTMSIGVADAVASDHDADDLLPRADAALYDAKRAGRNSVRAAPVA